MRDNGVGFTRGIAVAFAIILLLAAAPAAAYVGPGAGLSAIGTLVALVVAVFLAILGFVWYPAKRILGKSKATDAVRDGVRSERRPPTRG